MCGIGSRDVGDGSSFGFVAAGIEEEIICKLHFICRFVSLIVIYVA